MMKATITDTVVSVVDRLSMTSMVVLTATTERYDDGLTDVVSRQLR